MKRENFINGGFYQLKPYDAVGYHAEINRTEWNHGVSLGPMIATKVNDYYVQFDRWINNGGRSPENRVGTTWHWQVTYESIEPIASVEEYEKMKFQFDMED